MAFKKPKSTSKSYSKYGGSATVVHYDDGKKKTLLNPSQKSRKYAEEMKQGVKRTNSGQFKTDKNKKAIHLTAEQKAYRAGYLDRGKDSAAVYNSKKKKR